MSALDNLLEKLAEKQRGNSQLRLAEDLYWRAVNDVQRLNTLVAASVEGSEFHSDMVRKVNFLHERLVEIRRRS